jgi:hypothetical protein
MDTLQAYMNNLAAGDRELKVFDWEQAARIIRDEKPQTASAGLADDWEWTGGDIYRGGQPVPQEDTYTFLASTWATPELDVDGDVRPCWRLQSATPGWDSKTYWPPEALAVLHGDV